MFPPSQRIWSRSAKWLSKVCKFDSTKKGASSEKKAESSHVEEERARCSFSIHTRRNPPCSRKARKSIMTFKEKEIEGLCEACQFGKQHRHPFSKERNVSKGLLDIVHSDVWGPAQMATFGRCRYYVVVKKTVPRRKPGETRENRPLNVGAHIIV